MGGEEGILCCAGRRLGGGAQQCRHQRTEVDTSSLSGLFLIPGKGLELRVDCSLIPKPRGVFSMPNQGEGPGNETIFGVVSFPNLGGRAWE